MNGRDGSSCCSLYDETRDPLDRSASGDGRDGPSWCTAKQRGHVRGRIEKARRVYRNLVRVAREEGEELASSTDESDPEPPSLLMERDRRESNGNDRENLQP